MKGSSAGTPASDGRLVRAELERILASPTFIRATRLQRLLRYLVERELTSPGESPKEYEIGIDVFDRGTEFDPQLDAIVRVQLARLRTKLRDYSLAEGQDAPIVFELPKGSYTPVFRSRAAEIAPPATVESAKPVAVEPSPLPVAAEVVPVLSPALEPAPVVPAGRLPSSHFRLLGIVAGLVLLTAAVLFWRGARNKPNPTESRIVPIANFPGTQDGAAFSPDGRTIAFALRKEDAGNFDIFVKLVGAAAPLRLTSDAVDKYGPAWSPDGQSIAFMRNAAEGHAVYLVSGLGGTQRKVAQTSIQALNHLSWSPDGAELAFTDRLPVANHPWGIVLISPESGMRRSLTSPSENESDIDPAFSPDGQTIAFVRTQRLPTVTDLYTVSRSGGTLRRITSDHRMIRGVAWTPDGRDLVFSSNRSGPFRLWRISADGSGSPRPVAEAGYNAIHPAISLRGGHLAYTEWSDNINIWQITGKGAAGWSAPEKWIASSRTQGSPEFSPDGRRIVFASDRSGFDEIWRCDKDGSNLVQLTHFAGPPTGTPHWSPDSRSIVFDSRTFEQTDIFVIGGEGDNLRRLTTDSYQHGVPNWSRDGKSIYFTTNRTGGWQLWKMPAEGGNAVQVTKHGAFDAVESADGEFVYYSKGRFPGIWKLPAAGGDEVAVPELSTAGQWRYWTVTAGGYYYAAPGNARYPSIEFFDFREKRPVIISRLQNQPDRNGLGLAVSPDGKTILYAQIDQWVRDIMLVEPYQ